MKPALLTSIAVAIFSIIPTNSYGFADWVSLRLQITKSSDYSFTSYQHSDASGKGQVAVAYVLNTPFGDALYYFTYNLYREKSQNHQVANTSLVDLANEITSVQVRHDSMSGKTHFVYSLKRDALPEEGLSIPEVEVLRHAVREQVPDSPAFQFTKTDIITRTASVGIPFEISLQLRPGQLSGSHTPAIAYRTKGIGTSTSHLWYTERLSDGSWIITPIDSGPMVGVNCELAFSGPDHSAIVYEENNGDIIHLARRTGDGLWNTEIALLNLGSKVTDPTLALDGSFAQIAYVRRSPTSYQLSLRSESQTGVDHFQVPTGSGEVRSPRIAISNGRTVMSFIVIRENSSNIFDPWVATKNSVSTSFSSIKLPRPSQQVVNVNNTFLSLDDLGYPIITWSSVAGDNPRACFCPDFTDFDCDGISHLEEVALRMNPNQQDIHHYPKAEIHTNPDTGTRHLSMVFPTAYSTSPIIGATNASVETNHFRYDILQSDDLENWKQSALFLNELPFNPSQPTPGPYFRASLNAPIEGFQSNPSGYIRLSISRL